MISGNDPVEKPGVADQFQVNSHNTAGYRLDLVWFLVRRNFLLRYKGSALGVAWSLVPPLSQLLVLVFLFGKVVNLNIEAYPAFVLTGLLPWVCFSKSVSSAGTIFISNRDLVMKPSFEPYNLVIVETLSNLLMYLLFLPILFIMLTVYHRPITPHLLFFPFLLFIQTVLTVGLGLIIATLNVFYRDIQHIVSVAVTLLFYLTPVFYQAKGVSRKYQVLFDLNPVAALIENYRAVFFYGAYPDWDSLLWTAVVSGTVFGIGYFVYNRHLHEVFDFV